MKKTVFLKKIREMPDDELDTYEGVLRSELVNLTGHNNWKGIKNPSSLKILRRNIARIQTIRNEREKHG